MLTPLDIETKEFKKHLGGYSKQDVDEFMQVLLEDFKGTYLENISMKDKLATLTSAVQRYKAMEDIMQNTLVVAQSTSEDVKRAANDKARAIIAEAEAKAETLILDAKQRAFELELKKKELEYEIDTYKNREISQLRSFLSVLERKDNIPKENAEVEDAEIDTRRDTDGLRQNP